MKINGTTEESPVHLACSNSVLFYHREHRVHRGSENEALDPVHFQLACQALLVRKFSLLILP